TLPIDKIIFSFTSYSRASPVFKIIRSAFLPSGLTLIQTSSAGAVSCTRIPSVGAVTGVGDGVGDAVGDAAGDTAGDVEASGFTLGAGVSVTAGAGVGVLKPLIEPRSESGPAGVKY